MVGGSLSITEKGLEANIIINILQMLRGFVSGNPTALLHAAQQKIATCFIEER